MISTSVKQNDEVPEGVKWELGFAYFCTGKMGFGLLRVGIINAKLGMGNISRNCTAYVVNNIPKLKERLKKCFQFIESRKRNQRAALTTCSVSQNVFFLFPFLLLRVSYLVIEWF